ncbi:MAG: hypothetical protein RL240_965 [Planctomycetota bacterium]|jgi:hypothetical protein
MKRALVCMVAAMAIVSYSSSAMAIKEFGETWTKVYAEKSTNEGFKKLAAEAKCNVCHIDGENKKKHNPYGDTLEHEGLTKKNFPPAKFKENPEGVRKQVEELMKKIEDKKAEGSDKTFAERMKDGLLPGGDAKGK